MKQLPYFINLADKTSFNYRTCQCGTTPMMLPLLHRIGYEYLNICPSKNCTNLNSNTMKKMAVLFEEYRKLGSQKAVLNMENFKQFDLACQWLSELCQPYEIDIDTFTIHTDILRSQWFAMIEQ